VPLAIGSATASYQILIFLISGSATTSYQILTLLVSGGATTSYQILTLLVSGSCTAGEYGSTRRQGIRQNRDYIVQTVSWIQQGKNLSEN
jgi:hypothetical protein